MRQLAIVVLLLACAGVHWPGERADFSYDDEDFVRVNQSIRSLASAAAAFGQPFPPHQEVRGLYRPLTNFSYALDFARAGESARAFHRTNVLLYALVVLGVYALARSLHPGAGFATAVGVLFALHPAHCDAVDSISGRSEMLALLFALIALVAFLAALRQEGRSDAPGRVRALWAGSVVAYVLACLSKETGVVVPGIVACVLAVDALGSGLSLREGLRRAAGWLAPYVGVALVYIALRVSVLGTFSPAIGVFGSAGILRRLHAMGLTYFEYARIFFFPDTLQIDFYYRSLFLDPAATLLEAALGWLLAATILAFGVWLVLRRARGAAAGTRVQQPAPLGSSEVDRNRIALVALAILLGFFFPYSHLVKIGAIMAERFFFAPSVGAVLLAVLAADWACERWLQGVAPRRVVATLAVAVVALPAGWRSFQRAEEWRDDVALWTSAAEDFQSDFRVYANLATAYMDRGEFERAEAPLARARELAPNEPLLRKLETNWKYGRQRRH